MNPSEDMIAVVEPLIPRLRRYARSLLGKAEEADELVQDCLERAVSHWHLRNAERSAQAWLFTILHNLAVNQIRQRTRRGRHLSIDTEEALSISEPPRQEDTVFQSDIMRTLNHLPDDQRQVLLLVSVEDLSYAEVAGVLGVPIGTVMSRLSRARERLRELLGDEHRPAIPTLRRVK